MSRLTNKIDLSELGFHAKETAANVCDAVGRELKKINSIRAAVLYVAVPGVFTCVRAASAIPPEKPVLPPRERVVAVAQHTPAAGGVPPEDVEKAGMFLTRLLEEAKTSKNMRGLA